MHATVFRQKPAKLTVKILRSLLTSNGHKLKAQELRRDLLERENLEVTRAAITTRLKDIEQPDVYDDNDDDDDDDDYNDDEEEIDDEEEAFYDHYGGRVGVGRQDEREGRSIAT
ncbi:hypothetical protein N431DRAFT_459063 [Stipitochalara longipes BDJ]|nr:hypothetical protein N431DRAFT_459063 [Stipitochalara longipes BDJ]